MGGNLRRKASRWLKVMKDQELRKLPFDASKLPEDWVVINDRSSQEPIFLALPAWLFEKLKSGSFISDKDFSLYQSQVGDLEIDYHLN